MPDPQTTVAKLFLLKLSERQIPLPGGGGLDVVLGCYLAELAGGARILVDSGMAPEDRPVDKPAANYNRTVLEALAQLGVAPESIETVVCTHFDVDHVGFHAAFPWAEFVVQRAQWEARGGDRYAAARRQWERAPLRTRLVEGDTELVPGLTLLETGGHAPGHQSVLLRLPHAGAILLTIDAVQLERLFTAGRGPWPLDEDPAAVRASTARLIDCAAREQALVVFGHDGAQWKGLRTAPEFYD